uniref:NADH dehydrogenase subunit 2 n=1 Tax=Leptestheria dahalacensis TaxID=202083 RepID=UPI0022A6A8F9|nr:NADH dehydrogenase subunit 2 [Leptestheria dahalacensis]UNY33472.1 NADH dehydrogenase subunit 2 [Leptestheria dahalacensis]
MFFPFNFLCLSCLFLSVMIVISSTSWYTAWVGLELNLLSFLPLILTSKMNLSFSEASMKYFLVQALSSVLLLFGSLMSSYSAYALVLVFFALMLKLAAAPFHFWVISIVEMMSWTSVFLLFTIQKIAPLVLLFSTFVVYETSLLALLFIIFSAVIGSIGGLSQCMLRSMMGYSSINHMSWLLSSLYVSRELMESYFILYILVLLPMIILFLNSSFFHVSQLSHIMFSSKKVLSFFCLLSLGGLPPFLGFLPKWIVINKLVEIHMLMLILFLVFMALITLYYYLRLTYSSFMISSSSVFSLNLTTGAYPVSFWFFSMVSLMSLPVCVFIFT